MILVPSIDAFTIGNWRRAAVAARITNGRKVRPNPYWAWNCAFSLSRSLAILVMSALCTVVTCAEVRLLNTMCSAIFCRMLLMGSTRSAGAAPAKGAGSRAGGGGGAGTSTGAGIVATADGAGAGGGGGGGGGGGACAATGGG